MFELKFVKILPYFCEKIWGGQELETLGFPNFPRDEKIGEVWLISAHPHGMSIVGDGKHQGITLKELYEKHNIEIFNDGYKNYPLLSKIIMAHEYLPVQVHPDDSYAVMHEQSCGKSECWFALNDCNQKIIYGHNAVSVMNFIEAIKQRRWQNICKMIEIKKNDFIYIPREKFTLYRRAWWSMSCSKILTLIIEYMILIELKKMVKKENLIIKKQWMLWLAQTITFQSFITLQKNWLKIIILHFETLLKIASLKLCQILGFNYTVFSGEFLIKNKKIEKNDAFIGYDVNEPIVIFGKGQLLISYVNKKNNKKLILSN